MVAIYYLVCIGFVIAGIILFVQNQKRKKKVSTEVEQLAQESPKLNTPCKVQVFHDSSHEENKIRKKWPYAFSLNNGPQQIVNADCTIEFSTSLQQNALTGYGRGDYGGISRHPSLDSPFKFEAVEGGLIQLICKPVFHYNGGHGSWDTNIQYYEGQPDSPVS